jgi:hypothetical protein
MTKDWRNTWEETPIHFTDKHAAISMTLRDYFAGLAMQAFLGSRTGLTPNEVFAQDAYKMADAMLVARGEK